jgi:hypothetical protein
MHDAHPHQALGIVYTQNKNFGYSGLSGHLKVFSVYFYACCLEAEKRQKKFVHKTLALRGLEEPAHASRGLEELFLQLCCCVSFWFWREIGFGFTYYLCT